MEEAEGNPSQGQSCYEKTMNATALPWSTIASCVENEYDLVQTAAMDATPKHQCENLGDAMSCLVLCFLLKAFNAFSLHINLFVFYFLIAYHLQTFLGCSLTALCWKTPTLSRRPFAMHTLAPLPHPARTTSRPQSHATTPTLKKGSLISLLSS
jgi:hypothetical protein